MPLLASTAQRRCSDAIYWLGTLGTYFKQVRQPTERELLAIGQLAAAAARVFDQRIN